MTDSAALSAGEMAGRVRRGELRAEDVVRRALERTVITHSTLNWCMESAGERALADAARTDALVASGRDPGVLAGVPVVIKEATAVAGMRNSAGCVAYRDRRAARDAIVVERLRAAGAIVIGTAALSELASSSFCDSPMHGVTRNPWDVRLTPGGSSGGSAVAVATGCAVLAEGTDMGGSVRIPAAFTGVVGIKPSAGRIPNDDMVSLVDDIQHHGLLARTVADVALGLGAVSGPAIEDPQSFIPAIGVLDAHADVSGLRVAVSDDLGFFAVEPEIMERLHQVADALADAGCQVEHVSLGWDRTMADAWVRCWHVYLAAFFGDDLDSLGDELDPKLRSVITKGRAASAVEVKQLELIRGRQWAAMAELWRGHDLLLSPTMTRTAVAADGDDADYHGPTADGRKRGLDMTSVFNWVPWCPAISVPAGLSGDGLPIGVHLAAPPFRDDLVIAGGGAIERAFGVLSPPSGLDDG